MNPSRLDVCWVAHSSGDPLFDHLEDLRRAGESNPSLEFGMALIGRRPVSPPLLPQNIRILPIDEPVFERDATKPSEPLTDAMLAPFSNLLQSAASSDLSLAHDTDLITQLTRLLTSLTDDFRFSALWEHPRLIELFVVFHRSRQTPISVTRAILLANELLEALWSIVRLATLLPVAEVYKGLDGTYCNLVAAIAADHHRGKFAYSPMPEPEVERASFWLKVLPHHWRGSLEQSPVYRLAGRHLHAVARQVVKRHVSQSVMPSTSEDIPFEVFFSKSLNASDDEDRRE